MGWAVLTQADGVVSPHVNSLEAAESGQADGATHVVAEVQERGRVGDKAAVQGDAVGNRAHGVLPDAEAYVPATRLAGLEDSTAVHVGQVGLREVGGAAE